jgi:hypothetical protein
VLKNSSAPAPTKKSSIAVVFHGFTSRLASLAFLLALSCVSLLLLLVSARSATDPWTSERTMQPAALLKDSLKQRLPRSVLRRIQAPAHRGPHRRRAQYRGTAGSYEGLQELTTSAASLPHSTNLAIYCGCSPGALPQHSSRLQAASGNGFHEIATSASAHGFEVDWAEKGYPYKKGQ